MGLRAEVGSADKHNGIITKRIMKVKNKMDEQEKSKRIKKVKEQLEEEILLFLSKDTTDITTDRKEELDRWEEILNVKIQLLYRLENVEGLD